MSEKILLLEWIKIIIQGYEVVILQGEKKPNKRKHNNKNMYLHDPGGPWGVKSTFNNTDCSVFSDLSL